ncbi:MAG: homocysteine S-methyltransferase family protein, partial [Thermoanaerobaculia bacterium]
MTLAQALARHATILAEGSVYELLRRDPRVSFDPDIAHAGLVYDELLSTLLAGVHREYLRIANDAGLPAIAFADTWRASEERVARSRFAGCDVNGDNVRFIRELAKEAGGEVIVAAYTGPRGDGYRPDEAPGREEAMKIHAAQIEALAMSGVDLIIAATLPSLQEARGIASLLARSGVEWMLSFVVRRDGTLL